MTLVELLVAMSIMSIMVAALGVLSHTVKVSSDYTEGVSNATQHGRVALERIGRGVTQGYANENFPGAVVFADTIGGYTYPDTLVIWDPPTTPANANGLPLFSEIIVYCPNPSAPNQLLEITAPSDTRTVPAITDLSNWTTELTNLKTGNTSQKTLVTDLLRTAKPASSSAQRGCVRFVVELHPTAAEWASFRAGTVAFQDVHWVQTIYGSQTGLRQTWLRSELQLMPGYNLPADPSGLVAIPFLGSAAAYWNQQK